MTDAGDTEGDCKCLRECSVHLSWVVVEEGKIGRFRQKIKSKVRGKRRENDAEKRLEGNSM